jgi:hypothetical protein
MTLEDRFFDLYRGLDRARGWNEPQATVSSKGKRNSKNQTLHSSYTVENWKPHLAGKEGLGVIPITDDATCSWGAIDVDIYPLDLVELEQKLKTYSLKMVVLRSKSGGAHLTIYFKEMESCSHVRAKLAEISVVLGLGEREIYPKQVRLANKSDVGNWLNMPYFDVSNTERYAIINGKPASVEDFLDYAESLRLSSIEELVIPYDDSLLHDGPPCLQKIMFLKAGQGERNNVLFNLGVYCRLKWESNWEESIEQYNRDNIEPPLNHREVGAMIKSLEKKSYSYTCNNQPLTTYCNREACKGREFGVTAFQHIDVGVVLDSISKMKSEPPMWVVSLEGIRTEIETEDLLDQSRFRKVCLNIINKIPGRMKAEEWDKFIRNKLSELEFIEMPIETRASDQVIQFMTKYFDSTPIAKTLSEVTLGRWMTTSEGHIFRGQDYIDFLTRQSVNIDKRKLWSVLSNEGIRSQLVKNQELWVVPLELYTSSNERKNKFNIPDKGNNDGF